MKMVVALLVLCFLFAMGGCARKAPPAEDRSEILIRHLLKRINDSDTEISNLQDEMVRADTKCKEEQIAILKGRALPIDPKREVNGVKALRKTVMGGLNRMAQELLDAEDVIEDHNQRHPESPQADIKDLLRQMCGDCTQERAVRDLQLKEEAEQHGRTENKK
jgi:hypothetical protein